jgi:DNA-binding MarR family transcriptional regulator
MSAFFRALGLHHVERGPGGRVLSLAAADVLIALHDTGPLRQVELGRRLALPRSAISRIGTQLGEHGWVQRDPAVDDGRGVLLHLTRTGAGVAELLAEARRIKFAALLDRIPAEEHPAVLAALHSLAEAAIAHVRASRVTG